MGSGTSAARILLSYRRDDVPDAVHWIAEKLQTRFGPGSVFVDSTSIGAGEKWRDVLARSLASCEALLIVIGTRWLRGAEGGEGNAIDAPEDVVRQEIATALRRDISIVPVLWQGAELPAPETLPIDVRDLTEYQAFSLRREHFQTDVLHLMERLQAQIGLLATLGRRLVAFVIDLVPALLVTAAFGGSFWIFWALWVTYHGVLVGTKGRTLGKLVMGTRVERAERTPVPWLFAFARPALGYPIILISAGVGALQLVLHPQHIGLHDRLFRTRVMQTRRRPLAPALRRIDGLSYRLEEWLLKAVTTAGLGFTITLARSYVGIDKILEWIGTALDRSAHTVRGVLGRVRKSEPREATRSAADAVHTAAAPVMSNASSTASLTASAAAAAVVAPNLVVGLALATASLGLHQAIAPRWFRVPDPPSIAGFMRSREVLDLSGRWEFTNVQIIGDVYQRPDPTGSTLVFEPVDAGFVVADGWDMLRGAVLSPRLIEADSILASDSTASRGSCVDSRDGSLVAEDVYNVVTTWTFEEIPVSPGEVSTTEPRSALRVEEIRFRYVSIYVMDSDSPSATTCPDSTRLEILADVRRISNE